MQILISIELKAQFGFFKKPETNTGLGLSFNMIHKPALLGIFGAIIGLDGYIAANWNQKNDATTMPEFFEKLKDVRVGIEPMNHVKGVFQKKPILYTDTTGFNNKDKFKLPATRLIKELTLIAPAFRCYALLDLNNSHHQMLYDCLKEGKATYLPYFGKNEFYAWWHKDSFCEYAYEADKTPNESFEVCTLFRLNQQTLKEQRQSSMATFDRRNPSKSIKHFAYFERLPEGFDEDYTQYQLNGFVFTSHRIMPENDLKDLYYLNTKQCYAQLI